MMQDNYSLWEKHDAEQEEALVLLPVCSECGEYIQDDFCFVIHDEPICEECMNSNYRKHTTDLMG